MNLWDQWTHKRVTA